MTVLWNDSTNHVELEERTDQQHGQWNTITMAGGGKTLEIIAVYRIVDANENVVDSCKARHE